MIDIWAQYNNFVKRINASLEGVQFLRGGGAATEDFDDISEGAEAELIKTVKKMEALASKIPEKLRNNTSSVTERYEMRINLAGSCGSVYFNGNYRSFEHDASDHMCKIAPRRATLTADNPLVTEFEFYGFEALHQQIESDESEVRLNVGAVLEKVRTIKRLLEEWQEAKELLSSSEINAPMPPAIRRETLNEIIGLPSDEVTEA